MIVSTIIIALDIVTCIGGVLYSFFCMVLNYYIIIAILILEYLKG